MSDAQVFFTLLLWLAEQQDIESRQETINDAVYGVAAAQRSIHPRELEGCIADGSSAALNGKTPRPAIWLPPTSQGDHTLPFLTPRWDGNDLRELRLYVAIYFMDDGWGVDAMGFRYERPEGPGEDRPGRHDYWHAQPTSDAARGTDAVLDMRGHPDSLPAFPLEASSPAGLLSCMLISLYGARYATDIRASAIAGIDDVLDGLMCTRAASNPVPPPAQD